MTKVALTSQLRQQLLASGTSEEILLIKFSEWKQGPPNDHYWFGKDDGKKLMLAMTRKPGDRESRVV